MIDVTWVKLVEPKPEERARQAEGVWSECKRCGRRDVVPLPLDLCEVLPWLNSILEAHRGCAEGEGS